MFPLSDNRVFIIAELSANHNGSLENALNTVKAAKRAGADAIKLQTYTPDTITLDCRNDDFKLKQGTIWDGKYLYELYREAYTPWEWHARIFDEAKKQGLVCFSSPFDRGAVDLLESLSCPIYKIASFEITDIPLISYAASKGKPMIISTGIANEDDILLALDTCKKQGNEKIALLKCTSAYPSPIEDSNLVMIKHYAEKFGVTPGLSDHTLGITVPVAATALGAKVIEKHFIIDRSIGGPDASFSLNEQEFSEMVKNIRDTEKAIGRISFDLTPSQKKGRDFSRSLYVCSEVKKGEVVTHANVRSVRPGFGLHPKYLAGIIGKKFKHDVEPGTRFGLDLIE